MQCVSSRQALCRAGRPVGKICMPLQRDPSPSPEKATVQKDRTLNEVSTPTPMKVFQFPKLPPRDKVPL